MTDTVSEKFLNFNLIVVPAWKRILSILFYFLQSLYFLKENFWMLQCSPVFQWTLIQDEFSDWKYSKSSTDYSWWHKSEYSQSQMTDIDSEKFDLTL